MLIADRRSPRNTNSLQHWPSPTMRRPVSYTTHGPPLSRKVCRTGLTTVERVIDFPIFDLGAYHRGDDLVDSAIYHPAKFHRSTPTHARDIRYQISCGHTHKQTVNDILPAYLSACRDNKTTGGEFEKRSTNEETENGYMDAISIFYSFRQKI